MIREYLQQFLIYLVWFFLSAGAVQAQVSADDHIYLDSEGARSRAEAAYRLGDVETALREMQTAVHLRPRHPGLQGKLAALALEQQDVITLLAAVRQMAALKWCQRLNF